MSDAYQPPADGNTAPTDETVPNLPVPSLPPPQNFRRVETVSTSMKILIGLIAFTLIAGGLGFILYATTVQYTATLHSRATAESGLTALARNAATAHAQATTNGWTTANAKIYGSATAQAGATATLTAQAVDATATATTLAAVFTQATSGTATLTDAMSDNTGKNRWDETSGTVDASCVFTNGSYHTIEMRQGYFRPCLAQATSFRNFAYQVTMIIDKGNQGGILFRANSTKNSFYCFLIDTNGSYTLDLYQSPSSVVELSRGFSAAITTGITQSNQLAAIAFNNNLYLYANQQFITSVTDNTISSGAIGVTAVATKNPTEVEFSNAQVWNLTSNAFLTPTVTVAPTTTATTSPTPTITASPTTTTVP